MKNKEKFKKQMVFNRDYAGYIGCEREFFIQDKDGNIVPYADKILKYINYDRSFSYELSACQIEYKTDPAKDIARLKEELERLERACLSFEGDLQLLRSVMEVAPIDMPLDVYPDPRYLLFARNKSKEQLQAMMRVIACQFHVGMPDYDTALNTYNSLISEIFNLASLCDYSEGERIELYKKAAPSYMPRHFDDIDDHYEDAIKNGYTDDLGNCHSLVRITKYGTIEFRMFGAAKDTKEVLFLAQKVLNICGYHI